MLFIVVPFRLIQSYESFITKFEEELDNLFIRNSATGENEWVPAIDEPMLGKGPIHEDVDRDD